MLISTVHKTPTNVFIMKIIRGGCIIRWEDFAALFQTDFHFHVL